MSISRICLPLFLAIAVSGCHSFGPLVKRDSELRCPTDIRRTVPWCAGEDAIFHCPCGPTEEFYGHKPTCWRTWPAPATVWRDAYCSAPMLEAFPPTGEEAIPLRTLPPTESTPTPSEEIEAPPSLETLPHTTRSVDPGHSDDRGTHAVAPLRPALPSGNAVHDSRPPRGGVASHGTPNSNQSQSVAKKLLLSRRISEPVVETRAAVVMDRATAPSAPARQRPELSVVPDAAPSVAKRLGLSPLQQRTASKDEFIRAVETASMGISRDAISVQ